MASAIRCRLLVHNAVYWASRVPATPGPHDQRMSMTTTTITSPTIMPKIVLAFMPSDGAGAVSARPGMAIGLPQWAQGPA